MSNSHVPLSIQLWSTRGDDPLNVQLSELAAMGYTDVQPFHDQYDDVVLLRDTIQRHNLSCRSGHFKFGMFEGDAHTVINAARALGMRLVVAPWLDPEDRPNDADGWRHLHRQLQRIKSKVEDAGFRFAWHNHDFEFARLPGGSFGIEHLLGDDIDFAIDIGWIQRAGEDPAYWLGRYAGRVPAVHLKDVAPAGENPEQLGFSDVGHGILDWPSLWKLLNDLDIPLRIAEHDQPGDWRRFAKRSAESILKLRQKSHG